MVSPPKTLAIHTFGRLCSGSVCSSCSSDLSTSPKMVGYWLLIFFNLLNILFVLVDSLLFYYEVALFHLLIGDCCCRRSSAETVDGTSTAVATSSSSAAPTVANVAPRFDFLLLLFFFLFLGVIVGKDNVAGEFVDCVSLLFTLLPTRFIRRFSLMMLERRLWSTHYKLMTRSYNLYICRQIMNLLKLFLTRTRLFWDLIC